MSTVYVVPPILKPFLYGAVCLIWLMTQLSGKPNPASEPVSGWIQPIVIVLLVVVPEVPEVVVLEATLMLELQASRKLPPPRRPRRRRPHGTGHAGKRRPPTAGSPVWRAERALRSYLYIPSADAHAWTES